MNSKKKVLYYTIAVLIIPISIWSFTHFHQTSKANVKGIHANKISKISIAPTKTPIPTTTQSVKLSGNFYKKATPTPTPTISPTNIQSNSPASTDSSSTQTTNSNANNSETTASSSVESTVTSTPILFETLSSSNNVDTKQTNSSEENSSTNDSSSTNQLFGSLQEVPQTLSAQIPQSTLNPTQTHGSGIIVQGSYPTNTLPVNATWVGNVGNNSNMLSQIITTPPPVGADSKIQTGAQTTAPIPVPVGAYSESTAIVCIEGQTCQ